MVDKANSPSATIIQRQDRAELSLDYDFPTKQITSNWSLRTPFSGTDKRLGSSNFSQFSNSPNLNIGNTSTVTSYIEKESEQKKILDALVSISDKPLCVLKKPFVDLETKIGDKLQGKDYEKKIQYTMLVRSIRYNFVNESTEFKGDAEISLISRDDKT